MTKFIHRRPLRIEWGDCDPAQIVFYPRYFAFFDGATQELFRAALGEPKISWVKTYDVVGFPMVDTRAKFIIPSRYGDDIVIESRVAEFRRSSFDIEHRIMKGDQLAVEGFETRVWVAADPARPGGIKSKPIPDAVIRAFDRT